MDIQGETNRFNAFVEMMSGKLGIAEQQKVELKNLFRGNEHIMLDDVRLQALVNADDTVREMKNRVGQRLGGNQQLIGQLNGFFAGLGKLQSLAILRKKGENGNCDEVVSDLITGFTTKIEAVNGILEANLGINQPANAQHGGAFEEKYWKYKFKIMLLEHEQKLFS
jgi:hypothetical protein